MGPGYKELYEALRQQNEQLEKIVQSQEREIALLEKEVELYKEMAELRGQQMKALKKVRSK